MYRLSLVARVLFSLVRKYSSLNEKKSFVKSERQHSKAKRSVEFFATPQFHHFRAKKKNSHQKHFIDRKQPKKHEKREFWKISLILFVAHENFAYGRRHERRAHTHTRAHARTHSSSSSFGEEFVFCRGGGSFCSVGFCCGRSIIPVGIFFTTRKTIRTVSCSRN